MVALRPCALLAIALLSGCAAAPKARPRHRPMPPPADGGRAGARDERGAGPASAPALGPAGRAVSAAAALHGRRHLARDGAGHGDDCVALVRIALSAAGRPLPASIRDARSLHAFAASAGALRSTASPAAGDIVFLADRAGGAAAHVALVEKADPDGTALVLQRAARGVVRFRVNAVHRELPAHPKSGKPINDTLLVAGGAATAGSLVVAVARLL